MGKSKKSKARGGGDDLLDSSDADSMGSSSTALSDLSISYATEHVNSQEFVLDKYIHDLYEKRGSTREAALVKLVDAFESFMLHGLVENKSDPHTWQDAVVLLQHMFPLFLHTTNRAFHFYNLSIEHRFPIPLIYEAPANAL